MATITLKNIPVTLHQALKERALNNRRSLNSEILACLETTLVPGGAQAQDAIIEKARQLRALVKGTVTAGQIGRYKKTGRA